MIVSANGPVDFRSGHSLSAGRSGSLLGALAPAGSPVTSLSRRSRVPSAPINRVSNQPKYCHTLLLLFLYLLQSLLYFCRLQYGEPIHSSLKTYSYSLWLDSFGLNIEFLIFIELQTFIDTHVDWSGRCEDSCGSTGQVRPRRSAATRRLAVTPAESEAPGAQINRLVAKP